MQKLTSFYPVVCSENGADLAFFLQNELDFEAVYSSDWYWHLSLKNQPEVNVAVVAATHESVPDALKQRVQGVLLNLEMEDVSSFYEKCRNKQWEIVLPLKDEPWGQRHFIAKTPEAGLMLDIIQVIPASAEFADNYESEVQTV